jgi:lambda family phage portal protein
MLATPRRLLARLFTSASRAVAPTRNAAFYKGARMDQWGGDWNVPQLSASQLLRMDLTTLVDRSRDLVMNNTTAARVPTLFAENVTGKDGIIYQAAVKFANGNYNDRANTALEDSWEQWACDPAMVSADRRTTWHEVQMLLDQVEATDGETFLRLLPGFDNRFGFAVQVLDTDQIDRRYNVDPKPGQNAIVMGVEVDVWGAPVAYHVWPNHPSEVARRGARMRIPASEIIHSFLAHRPGQVRGVPWLAPAVVELVHLGEYAESEVMAARVSAAKMGFIENDGDPIGDPNNPKQNPRWDASPGTIEQLSAGQKFKEWNPLHPNGNFDTFEKAIVRRVATSLRLSYMSMSGDLSQTSYASGRLGFLAERMVYQMLQARRIRGIVRPVHAAWLTQALLRGLVDYPSFDPVLMGAANWHPRSFPGIDVEKETNAADHQVSMGVDTLTRLAAEMGRDIEDIAKERAREIAIFKKYGVPTALMSVPKGAAADPTASPAPASAPTGAVGALTLVEDAA